MIERFCKRCDEEFLGDEGPDDTLCSLCQEDDARDEEGWSEDDDDELWDDEPVDWFTDPYDRPW